MSYAQVSVQQTTVDGIEVVRLIDAANHLEVSIVPSIGNMAYDMKVKGQAVLWSPYKTLGEQKTKPQLLGVPFLAPWANRLDQDAFWANGKKYVLNDSLNNLRRDQFKQPIHGLVSFTDAWKVTVAKSDARSAWATSRLDFSSKPEWLAQFPFAHSIEMTYRLADGALEVHTLVENHSVEPMPLAIGFHPYFTIPGVPRDQWKLHLAAGEHVKLSGKLIPTGERERNPFADPLSLADVQLDDVFAALPPNAEFWAEGGGKRITVRYGGKYKVAVVYAPKGRDFFCFEPMTGLTNAFNLAQEGKYKELQSVPPKGRWQESFWIRASGY